MLMEKQLIKNIEEVLINQNINAESIKYLVINLRSYMLNHKSNKVNTMEVRGKVEELIDFCLINKEPQYAAALLNIIAFDGVYDTDEKQNFVFSSVKQIITCYAEKTVVGQMKDYNRKATDFILKVKKGAFGKKAAELDVHLLATMYNCVRATDAEGREFKVRNYIKGNMLKKQLETKEAE